MTGSYGLLGLSAKCGVARMTGFCHFLFLFRCIFDGHMVLVSVHSERVHLLDSIRFLRALYVSPFVFFACCVDGKDFYVDVVGCQCSHGLPSHRQHSEKLVRPCWS